MAQAMCGPGLARVVRRLTLAFGVMALTACTALYRNHGYMPLPEDLAQITVGVDTPETVARIAGTPTANGVLNDTGYYYVRSRFRHFGMLEPREVEREVLAITFTDSGVVRNIERFGMSEGRVVTLERRVTDDNLRDTTFIRQLLGNIGQFDAGRLIDG